MTSDEINTAEALLADQDYENCERFASRYGYSLIEIARHHLALLARVRKAYALMDNQEGAPNPWDSVCGQLPAGGLRCEELADQVRDILSEALTQPPVLTEDASVDASDDFFTRQLDEALADPEWLAKWAVQP